MLEKMNSGRGSSRELVQKIFESLKKGSKSIQEIADDTNHSRNAIAQYLSALEKSETVTAKKQGKNKIYHLNMLSNTYFNLPVSEQQKNDAIKLYGAIQKAFKEVRGRDPHKYEVYKLAYKANLKLKLGIPIGWYLHGAMPVIPCEESYPSHAKFYEVAKETAEHYHKNIKEQQYEEERNEIYLLKEEIFELLKKSVLDKEELYKKVLKLIALAPRKEEYAKYLDAYEELIDDARSEEVSNVDLYKSFELLWKLIATYNYRSDLETFYEGSVLDSRFKNNVLAIKDELKEVGTKINESLNQKHPESEVYKKIRQIAKNAKIRSPREIKEVEKHMKEYEKKHGSEALMKKIRDDFGL